MRKVLILILCFLTTNAIVSQKGVKIGYIDTEYILENLSEYSEVSERLETVSYTHLTLPTRHTV